MIRVRNNYILLKECYDKVVFIKMGFLSVIIVFELKNDILLFFVIECVYNMIVILIKMGMVFYVVVKILYLRIILIF